MKYNYKEIRTISLYNIKNMCVDMAWYNKGTNADYNKFLSYSNKENILYVNDYCLKCIYNFFSTLIKKKEYADEVCGLFMMNNSLKEKLITAARQNNKRSV